MGSACQFFFVQDFVCQQLRLLILLSLGLAAGTTSESGPSPIQSVSLSQKSSQIQKSSSKTSDSVGSQTTQLGAGAFQLMVVHYVASLFILESTAKGKNRIWHLWICACKTLVNGNHKQIIKRLKLGCKRLIFTELAVFYPPLFVRTEIPFQRTCKDSGATLLPQTAQGCFAKENGPQSAGVIENHEKYPSLIH